MRELVVVGAGVAGLSAAWHARRLRPELRVTVLEASARAGGLIETERTPEGFLLEHGPDSLMSAKPAGVGAVKELGLEGDLVRGEGPRQSYLLDERDRMTPMPEGLMGASPSAAWALMRSPLLSTRGKLRFLLEPCIPRRRATSEESVDAFFRRRFGAEMAERIVDPLLRGIYGTPTRELGLESVMPRMRQLEQKAGSVARASLGARPNKSGPPLVTLRDGMGQLTGALTQTLGGAIETGAAVRALERRPDGFRLSLEDGGSVHADAVVLALPAWASARVVEAVDRDLAAELGAIDHAPLVSINFAWRAEHVPHPMDGTGFVVSPASRRAISACTWSSRKWPGRGPAGSVVVRAFVRDAALEDEEAIAAARADLRDLMGIEAAPRVARVRRRARALPRASVGHRARVDRMAEHACAIGRLALAGNAHGGIGVPECIESGARAAAALCA